MDLRKTLKFVHALFDDNQIPHVLIGGLGLACYGSQRATQDLDLLVDEVHKQKAVQLLIKNGFVLDYESSEVLQFSGLGYVDLLLAKRPLSREMLLKAMPNGPEGISFARVEDLIALKIQAYKNDSQREYQDKADIQYLLSSQVELDWNLIKKYADLFGEWDEINKIKKKCQLG